MDKYYVWFDESYIKIDYDLVPLSEAPVELSEARRLVEEHALASGFADAEDHFFNYCYAYRLTRPVTEPWGDDVVREYWEDLYSEELQALEAAERGTV